MQSGLAALTVRLQPELSTLPTEALAERAQAWLAAHPGWLLVCDNATAPDHLAHLAALAEHSSANRVLVTSRLARGWHRIGASPLRLGVLSHPEAVELLTRTARPDDPHHWPGADDLAAHLDGLPLALEQAGAYLAQTRLTPAAYLQRLRQRPGGLLHRTGEGSDSERTLARIWRITLDHLAARVPRAGALLRTLAWLAPEAVPRTLLTGHTDPDEADETDDALGVLAAYNMVDLTPETVTVHRLVQTVARTPDPDDPHRLPEDVDAAREHATGLLLTALPRDVGDPAVWPVIRALLPHIDALSRHVRPEADTIATALLLDHTGQFLEEQGALGQAIAYLQRAVAAWERLHGPDHPDTLASRNNLASAHQSAGDLGRAIALYESVLADCERLSGADHPSTLLSRNNLASAYASAGDLGRAIPLFESVLADCERVLGADHPSALNLRNNLASAHQSAGDLGRAIALYGSALADCERILGVDHPATLTYRNNLATAYEAAGDLDRAIPLYESALADRERVLGADHPDTLASRNNLAYACESAGDLSRAILLYESTLADCERVLGPDHPDTLASRNNLAYVCRAVGDLGRAIVLYGSTLADRERVLGPDHPSTLLSRNNLADAYASAGDLGRAIVLYESALADCERVLGPDHPRTRMVRANLEAARRPGDKGG